MNYNCYVLYRMLPKSQRHLNFIGKFAGEGKATANYNEMDFTPTWKTRFNVMQITSIIDVMVASMKLDGIAVVGMSNPDDLVVSHHALV